MTNKFSQIIENENPKRKIKKKITFCFYKYININYNGSLD